MLLHIHTLIDPDREAVLCREAILCRDFLLWQGHKVEFKPHTCATFKTAGGTDHPVVYHNAALLACGFVNLVLHFHDQALLNAS